MMMKKKDATCTLEPVRFNHHSKASSQPSTGRLFTLRTPSVAGMRLNSVRLMVTRFTDCFLFYRDGMGLKVTWGELDSDFASFALEGEGHLAIFKRELMARDVRAERLPADAPCQDRFAVILQVKDLDSACDRLLDRGVELLNLPMDYPDYGIRAAHLRDPDGNLIEINATMPRERWTPKLREDTERFEKDAPSP